MVKSNFLTDKICQVEDLVGEKEERGGDEKSAQGRRTTSREGRKQGKNQEDMQLSSPGEGDRTYEKPGFW